MTEAATREFDQWMRGPIPVQPPKRIADQLLDALEAHWDAHSHDPAWCAEQDAMYWEGRCGEPNDMEQFDKETRDMDQRAYEDWCLTPHLKSPKVGS